MCYSARVVQKFEHLSRHYGAEVDWESFREIYMRRADGENIKMSRELDRNYLHPVTDTQRLTREYIDRYVANKTSEWETEIFTQRRRLGNAERSLALKETKKAREEVRIATKKVTALLERLADLRRSEPAEEDDRIFPAMYVPLIVTENGRRVIKPMRYACRLAGKPADYDQRFPGTYNARRDSLTGFWNNVYGRRHGLMVVSGFYENVPRHLYDRRELQAGQAAQNLVLEFNPKPSIEMLMACLWDRWTGAGSQDLYSFAAITDEPPQEIAATGHQRCIIALKDENLSEWLSPAQVGKDRLEAILSAKEAPYYEHRVAA